MRPFRICQNRAVTPFRAPMTATAVADPALPGNSPRRVLFASLIGTTIEFFDFYIYATAAVLVFPKLFFPEADAGAADNLEVRRPFEHRRIDDRVRADDQGVGGRQQARELRRIVRTDAQVALFCQPRGGRRRKMFGLQDKVSRRHERNHRGLSGNGAHTVPMLAGWVYRTDRKA